MTDQPHTPTTACVKDAYQRSRVWESGNRSWVCGEEFDRWHAAEIAAAEQRGAEQGWGVGYEASGREAYYFGTHGNTENPYRADQPFKKEKTS